MEPKQIKPGGIYKSCQGASLHVEKIEDGLVFYRTNGKGTLVSFEIEAFASLMTQEINDKRPDDLFAPDRQT